MHTADFKGHFDSLLSSNSTEDWSEMEIDALSRKCLKADVSLDHLWPVWASFPTLKKHEIN